MNDIDHFPLSEFACHDGTPYPHEWEGTRFLILHGLLEKIRAGAGNLPIIISSGFRTLAYDQKLYDASKKDGSVAPPPSSQHPQGRAADIKHKTLSPIEFYSLILKMYQRGEIPELGGIGLYPTFVHVDTRPKTGNHLAIWGGTRPTNIA